MPSSRKVPVAGSERTPLRGARAVGPTDPTQLVEFSVMLKRRAALPAAPHVEHLTHEELATTYGASPDDMARIHKFAAEFNLQVLETGNETARRMVLLAGTAANVERAFGVELQDYEHPDGTYRGRIGAVHVPEEIADIVVGVFGIDDRPIAHPHFRAHCSTGAFGTRVSTQSFDPNKLAALYGFPTGLDLSQTTVALIELGGGFRPTDVTHYFKGLGLPVPNVKSISVDHGKNRPTTPSSADGEVMLDIDVLGAVAPGVNIAVYFAPNTDRGFLDALSTAIHDSIHKPCAISISWGGPESSWTPQAMQAFDQVAQDAALLGITITAASGDNGSSDGVSDGKDHADFPASSPHILATGGTRVLAENGAISQETVWNDGGNAGATGGGYSSFFPRPDYQAKAVSQNHRGVPDVAGNADPQTGYNILVDGQHMVVGGTSAVAPLWAGLVALMTQKLGRRVGFLNPLIYQLNAASGFRDITEGNNGTFKAAAGWDPCTGQGSPIATKLIAALSATNAVSAD